MSISKVKNDFLAISC